ncbi:DUF4178 domain-containing protein [Streptomyces alkaliphilus]|uniref:DUF4178 domain-containing protein n=1 Tax=Streptomyces alkaliphilus TaxID=1472722 RepID=A0A7W3TH69_9ACTN|nr:DUF4178 domain-containing protein [Streptomyces alkaliphilus]MBB0246450.1 DUF4178 domain-containing protein [Streptomyces alkaliphilus]
MDDIVVVAAIIVALAGVAVAVAALRAARRRPAASTAGARRPADPFAPEDGVGGDPRTIAAGDLVEYLGERLFVRGSLRLTEGGFTWSEHFLDAMDGPGGTRRWLSVEEDPDLEVYIWTELEDEEPGTPVNLTPSAKTITVRGVTYHRTEHGMADYRSEGTTGLPASGRVEYADYDGPGGRSLAFERFLGADGRGSWEASLGERVPNGTLTIYPGDDSALTDGGSGPGARP